ncbi:hypothetical protein GT755_17885 [Herbidospora sp. NEAU-GS84]|uniref:HTH araC/xylS-type domain-containing protein n=1 Tax=Herbidospora solisilvae TaxID=2696284 RepID=A0A7C9NPA2_9ACTN|nr:hypothetical protein [Herbidospora solisilvae]
MITLLSRELGRTQPAQQIVLDRLLDLLLVLAIRGDFEQNTTAPRWYRASADPRLGAVLRAMHENAAHPWTVPEPAAISGLSRAAFARAFQEKPDQAPMRYLTEWRMTLARDHLRDGDLSLRASPRPSATPHRSPSPPPSAATTPARRSLAEGGADGRRGSPAGPAPLGEPAQPLLRWQARGRRLAFFRDPWGEHDRTLGGPARCGRLTSDRLPGHYGSVPRSAW